MTSTNLKVAKIGETAASKHLTLLGYKIVKKNFCCRWGEIDLIVSKGNRLVFVEVKTRLGDRMGKPHEAVGFKKIHDLKRAIEYFLLKNKYKDYKLSLDVVSIVLNNDMSIGKLSHFENVDTERR
jgi:putative endonuclease